MSFETPGDIGPSQQKKEKSHSPSEENFTWDTQSVHTDLTNHPQGIPLAGVPGNMMFLGGMVGR